MKPTVHLYAFLLLLPWMLGSCDSLKMQSPEFIQIKGLKFLSLKNRQLAFSLDPVIKNPNSIDLWVDGVDADIYFDGQFVGKAGSAQQIKIAAGKDSQFTLNFTVPIDKIKDNMLALVLKKEVEVKIDGKYTFKNSVKDLTIPYVYTTPINFKKEVGTYLVGY